MAGQIEGLQAMVSGNFTASIQASEAAVNKLAEALENIVRPTESFSEKIRNAVGFASDFVTVIGELNKGGISLPEEVEATGLISNLNGITDTIRTKMGSGLDTIRTKMGSGLDGVRSKMGEKLIKIGQDAAGDVEGGLFDKVGDAVENGFSKIGDVGQGAFEKLGGFIGKIPEGFGELKDAVITAKDNIVKFIEGFDLGKITDNIKSVASNVKSHIQDFVGSGTEKLKSFKDKFSNFDIKEFGSKIKDGISGAFSSADEKISGFGSKFKDAVSGWGGKIDDSIGNIGKKVGPSIENAGSSIKGIFGKSFDDVAVKSAVMAASVSGTTMTMTAEVAGATTAMSTEVAAATSTASAEIAATSEAAAASSATSASKAGARISSIFKTLAKVGIFLVVAAIAALVLAFKNLMETNDGFKEKVLESWEKVKEAFEPIIEAFQTLIITIFGGQEEGATFAESMLNIVTFITDGIASAVEFIAGIITPVFELLGAFWQEHGQAIQEKLTEIGAMFSQAWGAIQEIFSGVIEILKTLWGKYGEDIMYAISAVWEFIKSIFSGAINVITGIFDIIVGIFTGNGEKIKEGFSKIWEGIKGIFSGVGEFFGKMWDKVKEKFTKIGSKIGNAVSGAFKTVVNSVIGFAEGFVNKFIHGINRAIGVINKILPKDIPLIAEISIPRLASGALVAPGQMFIAREAGPELVGTFGSKTAVMNNNQIVESVSSGVYKAVMEALGTKGGKGSGTIHVSLNVDSKTLGEVYTDYHNSVVRQTGMSPLLV